LPQGGHGLCILLTVPRADRKISRCPGSNQKRISVFDISCISGTIKGALALSHAPFYFVVGETVLNETANQKNGESQSRRRKACLLGDLSFLLGILACFIAAVVDPPYVVAGPLGIPVFILGLISLRRIIKSKGKLGGYPTTISGILIGLCLIFTVIVIPTLERSKTPSLKRLFCFTKLMALSQAMHVYSYDHDDENPSKPIWCDLLVEYCDIDATYFQCRADKEGPCSYAFNQYAEMTSSADTVILFESKPGWNLVGGPEFLNTENHEGEGCTILFGDGHVEFVKTEELENLNWGGN
jgi:prepilin-type processing-associated H-X9-DG protein